MRRTSSRGRVVLLAMGAVLIFAATAYAATDIYEPDDTWAQATAIATDGVAQAHSISPSTDVDWVKFDVQAGHPYLIKVNGGGSYPRLYLYDSDGTTLIDSRTSSEYGTSMLYTAISDETIYAEVSSTQSYTISVLKVVSDAYELDNTWQTAKSVTVDGVAQSHKIDPYNDVDWVKFDVQAGHPYLIKVNGGGSYPRLYLYDSDGTTLIDSRTSSEYSTSMLYTAISDETIYAEVSSTQSYTISVLKVVSDAYELDNTWQTAKSVTVDGVAQSHKIDPYNDVDWVKFETEAGHPYRVSLTAAPYDSRLYLYDSDGTTLITSVTDPGYSKSILRTAEQSETLFVKVDKAYGRYSDTLYSISVLKVVSDAYELDNTWQNAKSITVDGVAQSHAIDPDTDVDWVKFEAEAGHPYRVSLTAAPYDSRLYLYDSSGTTLITSVTDPGYSKSIHRTAEQSETLFVKVDKAYGRYSDTLYSISIVDLGDEFESDDSCATARSIPADGTLQDRGLSFGDTDWVAFEAEGLTAHTVEIVPAGSGADALGAIEVYAADGTTKLATGTTRVNAVVEQAGTLYARVSGRTTGDYGRYRLKVIETPEAVLWVTPGGSAMDFAGVPYGTTSLQHITIVNAGGAALELTGVGRTGATAFALQGAPSLPRSLPAKQSINFDVAFSPAGPAPAGAPVFNTIYNGRSIVVAYSRYSVTLYSAYDFKNVGGTGTAPLEWSSGVYSNNATTAVVAGATYEVGAWVPTMDNWSYSGSDLFECTIGSSTWSQRFSSTSVGAGGPYLTRKPDATLTLRSTAGDRSWNIFGSAAPDSGDPTYLSMKTSPTALSKYGASTTVSGTLRRSSSTGKALSGQTVYVQSSSDGKTGWKNAKALTSSSTGYVAWSTVPRSTTYYRLAYTGKIGVYAAKVSSVAKVVPMPSVGTVAASRYAKRSYTLYGSLKPRHTARSTPVRVYRWRKVSGKWKAYSYLKASAYDYSSYTRYKVKTRFPYKGKWRLRTYHPADSGQASKWSSYRYLTVK